MSGSVVLVGLPGSGKTTCAKHLAKMLALQYVDTDELMAARLSCSIKEIFSTAGEGFFRQKERDLILELLGCAQNSVIATGGGMPAFSDNLELLQELGTLVYLFASPGELALRLINEGQRPLLASAKSMYELEEKLAGLLKVRAAFYERARFKIDTTGREPETIAEEVAILLRKGKI